MGSLPSAGKSRCRVLIPRWNAPMRLSLRMHGLSAVIPQNSPTGRYLGRPKLERRSGPPGALWALLAVDIPRQWRETGLTVAAIATS
jgi:hypothetical protein